MLTPAEEMGLSGLSLASLVRKAFSALPAASALELQRRLRDGASERHLVYLRAGELDTIRVLLLPLTLLPAQRSYVHSASLVIHNALKRLPELYMQDFALREVLRVSPEEEKWLWECWGPSQRENNPVFGRLDAMVDFTSPMWKDSLRFVEPNMSGIGGLHMVPTCEQLVAELVLPRLREQDSRLQLDVGDDIRDLLMQEVLDHLEAMGRPVRTLCFVEPKYAKTGPDEQEALAEYFRNRHGLRVLHADPAELYMAGGEACYEGNAIDVVYRDYPVLDLIALAKKGVDVEPMRMLFRQNRIVSSITAELDQKSCWEVFTDRRFTEKHFTPEERQVFRRHILWTRLVANRRTEFADGSVGDLLPYLRRERESLVLKPNRAYGGDGVVIGPSTGEGEWDAAIEKALTDSDRWVVQQLASIPLAEFPVFDADGSVHFEPFYTVMGFAPSKYGLAILGRASQRQVVNIAQRGGMCAVVVGHPPGRLLGPDPKS